MLGQSRGRKRPGEQWDDVARVDKFIEPHGARRHRELALLRLSLMRTDGRESEGPSWQAEPPGRPGNEAATLRVRMITPFISELTHLL